MDFLQSKVAVGIGAAVLATALAPVLIPVITAAGRPLAKSLIKGGMMLYERSREAVAAAGEEMEDLMAEVRAEASERHAHAASAMTGERQAGERRPPQGDDGQGRHPTHAVVAEESGALIQ